MLFLCCGQNIVRAFIFLNVELFELDKLGFVHRQFKIKDVVIGC
ncbi:Uncharacterised protein [Vibrio cholerae]|nr:Uncharacterised protein [Vibrio cholerae]